MSQYEPSEEMKNTILTDLHSDVGTFQQRLQGMFAPMGGYKTEYSKLEELRYIVKQMDMKLKLLGGWNN